MFQRKPRTPLQLMTQGSRDACPYVVSVASSVSGESHRSSIHGQAHGPGQELFTQPLKARCCGRNRRSMGSKDFSVSNSRESSIFALRPLATNHSRMRLASTG